jgi:hypothetical protein
MTDANKPALRDPAKPTEAETRMLEEVLRCNDHHEGFRSYVVMGSGSKGSNFGKISQQKRADSLVRKGHLAATPYGYEITPVGRAQIAAADGLKNSNEQE